jgi:ABC-type uncharacterized transport system substrate-binding protein
VSTKREFVTLLGGTAAWPLAVRAEQPIPVVGFLGNGSLISDADYVVAFRQGLKESGFVEGENVTIEYQWPDGQYDRLPALAADLVRRGVTVIAALGGSPSAVAAKAATATIPIVFISGADPVERGLVVSLNQPGANATGVTNLNIELGPKRMELLKEVVPTATTMAVLLNRTSPEVGETILREARSAARRLGVHLHVLYASTDDDLDAAFETMARMRSGALLIGADPFFVSRSERLASRTVQHALPAITQFRAFASSGGLLSYGASLREAYRLAGAYTGRVLKGEKPADLPVQQATMIELIINLKTAKALGLYIPPTLLARADEVIE